VLCGVLWWLKEGKDTNVIWVVVALLYPLYKTIRALMVAATTTTTTTATTTKLSLLITPVAEW